MTGQGAACNAMTTRLVFDCVAAVRAGRLLFENLSFSLAPGDAALITGPNGSGKSTLLRLAAGLLRPAAGEIDRTGSIALLTEASALDPELSLIRAIEFWSAIDGQRVSAMPALATLGLAELAHVPVRMLSTGQRRRAALARVVTSDAAIWLLDEPTNGLDDRSLDIFEALVAKHRADGGIALIASHLPTRWPGALSIALGIEP